MSPPMLSYYSGICRVNAVFTVHRAAPSAGVVCCTYSTVTPTLWQDHGVDFDALHIFLLPINLPAAVLPDIKRIKQTLWLKGHKSDLTAQTTGLRHLLQPVTSLCALCL
ncbi:hypothetical protein ABBQ32_005357 [Trebouxia sp. C0010 RCD-2024]